MKIARQNSSSNVTPISARSLMVVIGAFVIAHLFYWGLGVEFDYSGIDKGWQMADPDLLQHRLLESVFYTHSQPPLHHLLVGAVLKVSHLLSLKLLFGFVSLCLGLLLVISMYKTMTFLRVSPMIAVAGCVFFIVSPSTILYENCLATAYPVASLLMATFWFFSRFTQSGRFADGLMFAVAISSVALIRPTYHFVWVLGLILLAWRFSPRQSAWSRLPLILCCFLVAGVYVKNFVIFDTLTLSSWFSLNFNSPITRYFPEALRIALLDSGRLYISSRGAFVPLDSLGGYRSKPKFDAIPVLANERISSGVLNLNHYGYLEVSKKFMHDDLVMLRECPGCYLRSVGEAALIYLQSSSAWPYLGATNMAATARVRWIYDNVLYGRGLSRTIFGWSYWGNNTYPVILIGIPAIIVASIVSFIIGARRGCSLSPLLGGMVGTCILISAAYCLAEIDDNNRYRYELDPLFVTLGAFVVSQGYAWLREARQKTPVMVDMKV